MRCSPLALSSAACWDKQHRVRRERDVLHALERSEFADEFGQIRAQQRFAAGQPNLLHAQLHEQSRQPGDLIERQTLGGLQKTIVIMEGLPRHAVRAAEVAAIHDRNAQVVQRPAQRIARMLSSRGSCDVGEFS